MPEEEAFGLFVTLMNKYGLRDLFVQDMPGLHLHLYQFERLLEDLEPALYCHLNRRDVKPQLYATQWFLTLFAYRFPLQLVLRIYDLILSEGLEGAILKFGIVLMQKNAETLLGMKDMATLTTFLKERLFDVYIDKAPSSSSILESGFFGSAGGVDKEVYRADVLVQDAVSVKVTPEILQQYTAEWKEQQRIEKERETELQSLKDKGMLLEKRVRVLEHRAEQSDTEHVQVASELIKTKVENETLADENETLKMKTEELQKICDSQAAEVEARLKSEMETVMQKNIVVHNENRALEENMAEMEKELVATKMQWATVRSPLLPERLMLIGDLDQRRARASQTKVAKHHPDDVPVATCIKLFRHLAYGLVGGVWGRIPNTRLTRHLFTASIATYFTSHCQYSSTGLSTQDEAFSHSFISAMLDSRLSSHHIPPWPRPSAFLHGVLSLSFGAFLPAF